MGVRYAGIIIDISHEKVDRIFTYRIPEALRGVLKTGDAVRVPFGRGDTVRLGYVVELYESLTDTRDQTLTKDRVKDILAIEDKSLPARAVMVRLAAWMKKTYGATMIQALKTVLPVSVREKNKTRRLLRLNVPVSEAEGIYTECVRKKHKAKARLLKEMLAYPEGSFPYDLMCDKLSVSAQTVKSLQTAGVIAISYETVFRNPTFGSGWQEKEITLSEAQRAIVDAILAEQDADRFGVSLIHGITGSGKTEVYIETIREVVRRGGQAIVLIPEIALTYQTLMRFYRHFGERVSVMNSSLSKGERYDQFLRAQAGEIDVIIGPRSALFTPFPNLKLIIIDEEHESSYKSETAPRYHAVDTAIALAQMVPGGAGVVLGSATPSIRSYAKAMDGTYHLYTLKERLTGGTLARVTIADLRAELKAGNRSIFSDVLRQRMEACLDHGEQMMLFLNRRGRAGFVSCRACGHVFMCPHCDVSLSAHTGNRLVCHYCGYETRSTKICPECGAPYVSAFRAGTEQVVTEVQKIFPAARVLRMDADTTARKGDYEAILTAFQEGDADVLVGTQMIVKGHDFPNVTLMGILAADMSLYAPDYMAAERTFQLLTQAAGRSGRGEKEGEVIIQTYQPEHYSIQAAAAQDYERFYEEEIAYRRLLMYPPAAHLLAVQIQSAAEAAGSHVANRTRAFLERGAVREAVFIGPTAAIVSRINDIYRFVIYVKHPDAEVLINMKERLERYLLTAEGEALTRNAQLQFDLDPVRGY